MTHGHPPAIIYEDEREAYYSALSSLIEDEDLEPLESFIKNQVARTWEGVLI
jgi:hypothetical protein